MAPFLGFTVLKVFDLETPAEETLASDLLLVFKVEIKVLETMAVVVMVIFAFIEAIMVCGLVILDE